VIQADQGAHSESDESTAGPPTGSEHSRASDSSKEAAIGIEYIQLLEMILCYAILFDVIG
jgi:hypothetical protein